MTDDTEESVAPPPGPAGHVVVELRRGGRVVVREHVASDGAEPQARDSGAVDSRERNELSRERQLVLEWVPDEESHPDTVVIVDVTVTARTKAAVETRAVASPASASVAVTALGRTEHLELAIDASTAPGARSSSQKSRAFTAAASDELSRARPISRPFAFDARLRATSSAEARATAAFEATWTVSASLSRA